MTNLWQDMLNILKAPVAGSLDVKHLFLLIGIVLVMIAAWLMILQHVRSAAEEI